MLHAAAGIPVIPPEWIDQVTKGVEVVTLAKQLVLLCCSSNAQSAKL